MESHLHYSIRFINIRVIRGLLYDRARACVCVCVSVYQFTHFVTYASFGTSTSLLFAHGLQQSGTIRLEFRAGEPHPHQTYSPGRAALRYV